MWKPFSEHINRISFVNVFLKLKFKIFYFFKSHVYIFSFCGSQRNMMWYRGHLRCDFCPTIKKSEILSVKGLRDQFWKWRRRLAYDLKDIYVLPFLLKVFPKKIDTSKNWWIGVTRSAKVVQKMVVFARNRCDVFISFWHWKNSWLGIERVCARALIRRKRINFLVFWKNILSHILHVFCNTLNCPFE